MTYGITYCASAVSAKERGFSCVSNLKEVLIFVHKECCLCTFQNYIYLHDDAIVLIMTSSYSTIYVLFSKTRFFSFENKVYKNAFSKHFSKQFCIQYAIQDNLLLSKRHQTELKTVW